MPDIATTKAKECPSDLIAKMQLADLMGGSREVIIVHQGDEYHLRLTSNNKLILTK